MAEVARYTGVDFSLQREFLMECKGEVRRIFICAAIVHRLPDEWIPPPQPRDRVTAAHPLGRLAVLLPTPGGPGRGMRPTLPRN